MAGAARADITPPVGTCLYGYAPDWHSDSVHEVRNGTGRAEISEKIYRLGNGV